MKTSALSAPGTFGAVWVGRLEGSAGTWATGIVAEKPVSATGGALLGAGSLESIAASYQAEVAGRLPAALRVAVEAASQDRLEARRRVGPANRKRHGGGGHDRCDQDRVRRPVEGPSADDHLVEDAAERPEIGARIRTLAFELLRRHVRDGADHRPLGAQGRCSGRRRAVEFGLRAAELLGETEVEHLGAVLGEHDVAGLEVAVDDRTTVRRLHGLGDLAGDTQGIVDRQGAASDPILERLPLEVLHDQEERRLRLRPDVVKSADVGVLELRDGPRLTLEPAPVGVVRGQFPGQDLDGHGSPQPRVFRSIHLTHAPLAEERNDLVGPETGPRFESHDLSESMSSGRMVVQIESFGPKRAWPLVV